MANIYGINIGMNIELIDLKQYKDFSKLTPFIESFKDFDINAAIKFLEDKNVKDTEDMDAEYWHHAVGTESGTTYTSNWIMKEEDEEYLDDPDDFKGVWKYVKFYSPKEFVPDFYKNILKNILMRWRLIMRLNYIALQVEQE